jgi:hypothetical protein
MLTATLLAVGAAAAELLMFCSSRLLPAAVPPPTLPPDGAEASPPAEPLLDFGGDATVMRTVGTDAFLTGFFGAASASFAASSAGLGVLRNCASDDDTFRLSPRAGVGPALSTDAGSAGATPRSSTTVAATDGEDAPSTAVLVVHGSTPPTSPAGPSGATTVPVTATPLGISPLHSSSALDSTRLPTLESASS